MYGMEHGGWMFGGGFMMLLWWLLPIAVVAAIVIYLARVSSGSAERSDALRKDDERRARGDAGKDEVAPMGRDTGR